MSDVIDYLVDRACGIETETTLLGAARSCMLLVHYKPETPAEQAVRLSNAAADWAGAYFGLGDWRSAEEMAEIADALADTAARRSVSEGAPE